MRKAYLALLTALLLLGSYSLAVTIRLVPIGFYGVRLTADDPLLHYRMTKYLIENGALPERDMLSWYPWGRPIKVNLQYYTTAVLYSFFTFLGLEMSVYEFSVYIPAFLSSLACIVIYFLAKELWNRVAGLASAYLLAVLPGYLTRTHAGFYRHEQMLIPTLLVILLFTVKAMRSSDIKKTILYSLLSGLGLIYISGLSASFRFVLDGYAVFLLLMIVLKRCYLSVSLACSIPMAMLLLTSPFLQFLEKLGGFPMNIESFLAFSALLATAAHLLIKKRRKEYVYASILPITLSLALLAVVVISNTISLPSGRILLVLNPWAELPPGGIAVTVAEQQMGSLEYFLNKFGLSVLFIPTGYSLLLIRRGSGDVLIATLTTFSIYFSFTMVRLLVLAAPFVALLVGANIGKARELFSFKKLKHALKGGKKEGSKARVEQFLSLSAILLLLVATVYATYQGYDFIERSRQAHLGLPFNWEDACTWLGTHTPSGAVIMSWWDYGYYIQTYSNRPTLADGATTNGTQIRLIAEAFLSEEEQAIEFLRQYDVKYVVIDVFHDVYFGKWYAMAYVAQKNPREYVGYDRSGNPFLTDKGSRTLIFRMAFPDRLPLKYFKPAFITSSVYVFEVIYP